MNSLVQRKLYMVQASEAYGYMFSGLRRSAEVAHAVCVKMGVFEDFKGEALDFPGAYPEGLGWVPLVLHGDGFPRLQVGEGGVLVVGGVPVGDVFVEGAVRRVASETRRFCWLFLLGKVREDKAFWGAKESGVMRRREVVERDFKEWVSEGRKLEERESFLRGRLAQD